jgi:hypothetical protein
MRGVPDFLMRRSMLLLVPMIIAACAILYIRENHPAFPSAGPILSREAVLRISRDTLAMNKIDPLLYKDPLVRYEKRWDASGGHSKWSVTYFLADKSTVGGYFVVEIDDETKAVKVIPGA